MSHRQPSAFSYRVELAWLVLVACCLAGCGQTANVTVTGKVLKNDQPLQLSPTGSVMVTLIPDVAPGTPASNKLEYADASGNFTIQDVPPGKYKVAIVQLDPDPGSDKLAGAFSAKNTKIVREIDGKTPLNIDLARPE